MPLPPGPRTAEVDLNDYHRLCYISQSTGCDETGDGSSNRPWKSIGQALENVRDASVERRVAILVAAGTYREPTLDLREGLELFGGFLAGPWRRDITEHRTVLKGSAKNRILVAADHTRIDGFTLRGAMVRGPGAAVYCNGSSPTISNNCFADHRTKKPKNWSPKHLHETANDGAAVYCCDGAAPSIRQNLFAENYTEIGRGAAIAMHGHCRGEIVGCVFLDNATGVEDQDRSSDGGAVSVFDWSGPLIEGNVFLENKSFNSNDGGALSVALWSSPKVRGNVFVGNRSTDDGGAVFIAGQEHRYDRPQDLLPARSDFLIELSENLFLGNENVKRNSGGIRLTKEARATLRNNILARDARLYVQNSEVEIVNNTILEDTILRDMSEETAKDLLANNLFWGRLQIGVRRRKSAAGGASVGEPAITGVEPRLADKRRELEIVSSTYDPALHLTQIDVSANDLVDNALVNRVVRFENRWGVVKTNQASHISVWGDVRNNSRLVLLPTYEIHPDSPQIERSANIRGSR